MAGCCPSHDYRRIFNQRFARRLTNRYSKRGLDKTARTMVQFLQQLGIEVAPHALPDHARITAADIRFPDALPVLMTEKDAVKSRAIADQRHWAVRMDVMVSEQDAAAVRAMLDRLG